MLRNRHIDSQIHEQTYRWTDQVDCRGCFAPKTGLCIYLTSYILERSKRKEDDWVLEISAYKWRQKLVEHSVTSQYIFA